MTAQVAVRITPTDVEQAWQESIIAADLYEIAGMRNYPRPRIDQLRDEMIHATNKAVEIQNQYWKQTEDVI